MSDQNSVKADVNDTNFYKPDTNLFSLRDYHSDTQHGTSARKTLTMLYFSCITILATTGTRAWSLCCTRRIGIRLMRNAWMADIIPALLLRRKHNRWEGYYSQRLVTRDTTFFVRRLTVALLWYRVQWHMNFGGTWSKSTG